MLHRNNLEEGKKSLRDGCPKFTTNVFCNEHHNSPPCHVGTKKATLAKKIPPTLCYLICLCEWAFPTPDCFSFVYHTSTDCLLKDFFDLSFA